MNMKFSAPCIFGLEGLCANELRYLGVENVNAENGRVTFTGDWSTLALANINSRYAERILILLAEFEVHTFDNLFEGVKAIPWEDYIGISEAFPVKGRCLDSDLMSVPDCQKIVKKAVADRLSQKYMLPWFDETGAPHQIQFLILRNKVSIMLDTLGAGLHKRGYRADSNDAPIKALNIAPGLNRYFACEHWNCVPKDVFETARENARQKIRHDATFRATGYDIDDSALAIAKKNAEIAGVADRITFANRDIKDFELEDGFQTIITNPPYGERLLDVKSAEKLYAIMGEHFKRMKGKSYTVISPDDDFEKIFGRKADKRRKLYNGTLKCELYMYFK